MHHPQHQIYDKLTNKSWWPCSYTKYLLNKIIWDEQSDKDHIDTQQSLKNLKISNNHEDYLVSFFGL